MVFYTELKTSIIKKNVGLISSFDCSGNPVLWTVQTGLSEDIEKVDLVKAMVLCLVIGTVWKHTSHTDHETGLREAKRSGSSTDNKRSLHVWRGRHALGGGRRNAPWEQDALAGEKSGQNLSGITVLCFKPARTTLHWPPVDSADTRRFLKRRISQTNIVWVVKRTKSWHTLQIKIRTATDLQQGKRLAHHRNTELLLLFVCGSASK